MRIVMAHERDFEGGDLVGTAIVIGTVLLGASVLFVVLYAFSVHVWH
jgi:hypothetical protein